jgi:hypothetical protein
MKNLIAKIVSHLKFPSTWQGIIALVVAAGINLAPELQNAIVTAGVGLGGLIAFLFSDTDVA